MSTRTPQSHVTTRPSCLASKTAPSAVSHLLPKRSIFKFLSRRASPLPLAVVTEMLLSISLANALYASFRENHLPQGAHRRSHARLHARGWSVQLNWHSPAPSSGERRHPQSRSQVAEARQTGKCWDLKHGCVSWRRHSERGVTRYTAPSFAIFYLL